MGHKYGQYIRIRHYIALIMIPEAVKNPLKAVTSSRGKQEPSGGCIDKALNVTSPRGLVAKTSRRPGLGSHRIVHFALKLCSVPRRSFSGAGDLICGLADFNFL